MYIIRAALLQVEFLDLTVPHFRLADLPYLVFSRFRPPRYTHTFEAVY